jgi:hypothetical protein
MMKTDVAISSYDDFWVGEALSQPTQEYDAWHFNIMLTPR